MTVEITFKRKRYVSEAQEVIKELKTSGFRVGKDTLTSTQIRNLLASTTPLYDAARTQRSESYDDRISVTRINAVYQSGRNQAVKKLVISSKMLIILEIITREKDLKKKREYILRFCKYMEALVAYFKFYEGQD
ncbi:type III-A CRISPR-associated protein Csm2 [Limosilactobacillus fermentum]|uniref:type III-A CRISPR-associated protein Csm2 n=1 Tax=Limosilactobacillus fermentum TaxID=1613 RepID=UPI0030D62587